MNGWGRQSLNVTPSGRVLPCHAAENSGAHLLVGARPGARRDLGRVAAFNAFRGTDWMREPCLSCPRKEIDFGGCRCQALALTGDARNTDPVWSFTGPCACDCGTAGAPASTQDFAYQALRCEKRETRRRHGHPRRNLKSPRRPDRPAALSGC